MFMIVCGLVSFIALLVAIFAGSYAVALNHKLLALGAITALTFQECAKDMQQLTKRIEALESRHQ